MGGMEDRTSHPCHFTDTALVTAGVLPSHPRGTKPLGPRFGPSTATPRDVRLSTAVRHQGTQELVSSPATGSSILFGFSVLHTLTDPA
jgi:hypothetical protein